MEEGAVCLSGPLNNDNEMMCKAVMMTNNRALVVDHDPEVDEK